MTSAPSIIAEGAPPPRSSESPARHRDTRARDDAPQWCERESLLPFHSPSTILISGCTQSGKTHFTKRLLENAAGMFDTPPQRIIYAYSEYQPVFDIMKTTIPNITFHKGLPDRDEIEDFSEGHVILVLDDLMLKITASEECVQLFTVTSHHKNVSVLFLTQNLYPPGRYARSISLNCAYVVLFRNDRDQRQVTCFASQILPGQTAYFKDAYDKATKERYGYLMTDLSPHSDKRYRLRTRIFPGEDTLVYAPRV